MSAAILPIAGELFRIEPEAAAQVQFPDGDHPESAGLIALGGKLVRLSPSPKKRDNRRKAA